MGLTVAQLVDLDASNVRQTQAELAELMQEFNPALDVKRGVLYDLLFYNSAIYAEKSREEFRRLKRSQSLLAATADPDLAEDDILDAAASNYGISRKDGSQATGDVTVVVSTLSPLTIAAGEIFEAGGKEFQTLTSFAAKTVAATVSASTDRILNPTPDGNYSFTIKVTAVAAGEASQIEKDTLVIPQNIPITFVTAFAAADFTGGRDEETNTELIGRLLEGAACLALSGDVTMTAALRGQTAFADVLDSSVIGLGDPEMLRDQHSIFPGSHGGRVDWYVRSQKTPQLVGVTKTATLVEKTTDGYGIWQFGVARDELPGFYDVSRIVLASAGVEATSFAVTSDVRSNDLTALDNDGFLPDLATAAEGAYSRFQSAVIQFKDTETLTATLTAGAATADYAVTLRGMPLVAEMQDWVSSRSVRNRAGDALIKAPIPCFLRVSFTIHLAPGQATPDTSAIADDLASRVNTYGFTGRLPASALADVIHGRLSGIAHVNAIDLLGDIRRPDGVIRRVHSTEVLVVPDEPTAMVTGRTVGFVLTPNDVAISVTTADIATVI